MKKPEPRDVRDSKLTVAVSETAGPELEKPVGLVTSQAVSLQSL